MAPTARPISGTAARDEQELGEQTRARRWSAADIGEDQRQEDNRGSIVEEALTLDQDQQVLGTLSRRKSAVTATGSVAAISAENTSAGPHAKSGTIARPRNAAVRITAVIPMAATTPGMASAATATHVRRNTRGIDVERRLEQQSGEEHREEQLLRQMHRLDGVQRSKYQANDHQRDRIRNGQASDGHCDRRGNAKQDDECACGSHGRISGDGGRSAKHEHQYIK